MLPAEVVSSWICFRLSGAIDFIVVNAGIPANISNGFNVHFIAGRKARLDWVIIGTAGSTRSAGMIMKLPGYVQGAN